MYARENIYAIDIETDTSGGGGLDPTTSRITEISISTEGEDIVCSGPERALLEQYDSVLMNLRPGLVTTWNGAFFDIPFIAYRTARALVHDDLPTPGIHVLPAPGLTPKYNMLPGETTAKNAIWLRGNQPMHQHLDISFAYKRVAAELGVSWSLKPVCKALDINMIEVDRENMHQLTDSERRAYAASDTRGTRELAIRLLGA